MMQDKRLEGANVPETVRAADRDRYFAALFAPAAAREVLFALYAFNHEIARTAESVSEPMLGAIRLQWWRETVLQIWAGQAVRAHPVALAVADALAAAGRDALPQAGLLALIDARERELEGEMLFEDEAALEAHGEATASALIRLGLGVLSPAPGAPGALPPALAAAAREGGLAWAYTGFLRALPFQARRRRIFIPRTILRRRGADPESVFAGRMTPGLARAMEDMSAMARTHLVRARAKVAELPARERKTAMPAWAYLALCEPYLKRMGAREFDPFAMRADLPDLAKLWRMLRASLKASF